MMCAPNIASIAHNNASFMPRTSSITYPADHDSD
jgi:hypothetical protein